MSIGLVVDSTARLTPEDTAVLDACVGNLWTVVDLTVSIGGHDEADSHVSPGRICRELAGGARVTTSMPSPGDFAAAYDTLVDRGAEAILVLTLSASLSGTYQAARTAAAGRAVTVVDSRSTSAGLAGAVLVAAHAIRERAAGAGPEAVAERVARWCAAESTILFLAADLEFLRRGGRLGAASALVGRALSIVPVLGLVEGSVVPVFKVRTVSKARRKLVEEITERARTLAEAHPEETLEVVVLHPEADGEEPNEHQAHLTELVEAATWPIGTRIEFRVLSPIISAHVGPGTCGIAVQTVPSA